MFSLTRVKKYYRFFREHFRKFSQRRDIQTRAIIDALEGNSNGNRLMDRSMDGTIDILPSNLTLIPRFPPIPSHDYNRLERAYNGTEYGARLLYNRRDTKRKYIVSQMLNFYYQMFTLRVHEIRY